MSSESKRSEARRREAKPSGEELKALMKGALNMPDVIRPIAPPIAPDSVPEDPAAPQDAPAPAVHGLIQQAQTALSGTPDSDPPVASVPAPADQSSSSEVPSGNPASPEEAASGNPPTSGNVVSIDQPRSSEDRQPGKVGRPRHSEPLRNITLSLDEAIVDRLWELSGHERVRLRRAVDISELARHLLSTGLAQVKDNQVLPEEAPVRRKGAAR